MIVKSGQVTVTRHDIDVSGFEFRGIANGVVTPTLQALRFAQQRIADAIQREQDRIIQELAEQVAALDEGGDDW